MEIPFSMRRAIGRYEAIETEGLTLYPILVKDYESFLIARPAIAFMARSLPVRYLSEPLLCAFHRMDYEAVMAGQPPAGFLYRTLLFLSLSLRLWEGQKDEDRVKKWSLQVDKEDPGRLVRLGVETEMGDWIEITPVMFQRLRPILAAQNGLEIPSDDANPDLVEAERELAAQKGPKLDVNLESLMSGIAALSGKDEAEIEKWPILKLHRRKESFSKILNFLACSIGEVQGAKWKKGNPYPSPFYDRLTDDTAALISLDSFAGGAGKQAVANAGGLSGNVIDITKPKGVDL